MGVYAREEIPERFHYKKGKFVSPLTLVAEPGWFIAPVMDNLPDLNLLLFCIIYIIYTTQQHGPRVVFFILS